MDLIDWVKGNWPRLVGLFLLIRVIIGVIIYYRKNPHLIAPKRGELSRNLSRHKPQSLEQMIANLAACGVNLVKPFTLQDLDSSWGRDKLESGGYLFLLMSIGSCEEEEPFRQMSNNVYCFDVECIEDDGDYSREITALANLSQGALKITDLRDVLNADGSEVIITLRANGKPVRWQLKQDDDWFNSDVLEKLSQLLHSTGSPLTYFAVETGDQNACVGCLEPRQVAKLRQLGIPAND